MKSILFLILFLATSVHASELSMNENHFHLFTMKCKPEGSDGPETVPQSPPLNVDDPSTPGCNRWEINIVADGDLTRAQNGWELPLLDVNYGVGDNIQLKYELPYLSTQSGDTTQTAAGESKVGIKYMFFDNERTETQFAIYPQYSLINENADAVKEGLVSSGSITTLPLLISTKIGATSRGNISLSANLGYNISSKNDTANFVSAAIGVGTPLLNRVGMMSEISTEQSVSRNLDGIREHVVKASVGLVGTISKQFLLFGSIGHSLVSSDSVDHIYTLVGFRVLTSGGEHSL